MSETFHFYTDLAQASTHDNDAEGTHVIVTCNSGGLASNLDIILECLRTP